MLNALAVIEMHLGDLLAPILLGYLTRNLLICFHLKWVLRVSATTHIVDLLFQTLYFLLL